MNAMALITLILGRCKYFPITDVTKFVLDVITSFTLYVLIPKFGAIFTKSSIKVFASFSSEMIIVDFSFKEIVLEVLTLFLNTVFLFSKILRISNNT